MPTQQGQGLPGIGSIRSVKNHSDKRTQRDLGTAQSVATDRTNGRGEDLGTHPNSPPVSPSFNRGR